MTINVVCPHCEEQHQYEIKLEGEHSLTCKTCSEPFNIILATNRAKRSRGQKSTNSRFFSIRYTIAGSDRFVEFDSNDYQDIELRSKDVFILSYVSGQVRVIQNLTVAAYWPINKPTQGCLVIVMVIGLGLAIIPALAMMA